MPTAVALTHVPTNHPVSIGARKNNRQKAGHQSTNGSPAQQGEPPPSGPHYRHRCRTPLSPSRRPQAAWRSPSG